MMMNVSDHLRALLRPAFPASIVATIALLLAACGDDAPARSCTFNTDCPSGQVCTGGRCVVDSGQSCRTADDCEPGQLCEQNVCVDDTTADMGPDVADTSPDTTPDTTPDVVTDTVEEVTETAPVIVSTDPADGATGVSLNATVSIVFDQAMEDTTFTSSNVRIEDFAGLDLNRRIAYNEPTFTVTLDPVDAGDLFDPASPYTLILEREVRAANQLNLAERFEATFFTVNFPDQEDYEALARAYAPVIYQSVRDPSNDRDLTPRMDWFTSLDFDSDLDAANNLANLSNRSTQVPAHVYWNVLETETHYLIQYILYYPAGATDSSDRFGEAVEHDFTYSTVAVQKIAGDPLGRFAFAEGFGDDQVWVFGLDEYPDPCGGTDEPECGTVTPDFDSFWVDVDPDDLEAASDAEGSPGRRYPMYVTDTFHASCLAPSYDPRTTRIPANNRCSHEVTDWAGAQNPFSDADNNTDESRVLRLADGEQGGVWNIPEAGLESPELTYTLSSFTEAFWITRGNEDVWDDTRVYEPPADAAGAGGDYIVPSRLTSDADTSVPDFRAPPFRVVAEGRECGGGCSRVGVWFIDPVWEFTGHITAEAPAEFSRDYCFNPYLGIDIRGQGDC